MSGIREFLEGTNALRITAVDGGGLADRLGLPCTTKVRHDAGGTVLRSLEVVTPNGVYFRLDDIDVESVAGRVWGADGRTLGVANFELRTPAGSIGELALVGGAVIGAEIVHIVMQRA